MMAKQLAAGLREELKEALNAFSPGGSIAANEWEKILGSLAEKMSNDEVDSLLKQADKSGRGNIKHEGESRFLFAMPRLRYSYLKVHMKRKLSYTYVIFKRWAMTSHVVYNISVLRTT